VERQIREPKYLHYAVVLFAMFMLADQVMMYRLVEIGPFSITAGAFLMPFYYFLGDLIAEVYGFHVARRMIVAVLVCCIIFSIIITLLNQLPVPSNWAYGQDYNIVLGHLIRSTILGIGVAVLIGSYVNAYVISKLKVLTKGRVFIIRCIGSSAIGELIQMILGCLLLFTGIFSFHQVLKLIIELYVTQVALGALIATIGSFFVYILKRLENKPNDLIIRFNPLSSKIEDSTEPL
jgi:uncharacterized integral membrane protein (TIGR00697 family)